MRIGRIEFLVWLPFFHRLEVQASEEAEGPSRPMSLTSVRVKTLQARPSVAEGAGEGAKVTSIALKRFFEWAAMPSGEVPSGKVVTAACAFLIRSVLEVSQDQGPKKSVLDVGIALKLCNQSSLWGQLVDITQPRGILNLFLNVLTTRPRINYISSLSATDIEAYVFDGGQPSMLLVAGPTAAGKSFGSSRLLSAVFAQDALLKDTSLLIHLDNDNFKGLVEKVGGNKVVKLAAASFLVRCRVTFSSGSRGKCIGGVMPLDLQQVVSPPDGYRSLLLVVMASRETVTCNANMRAVIDGKTASPKQWDASMSGIKTVLGHLSESHVASPVWVWFNEVVAICSHGDYCINGVSSLGIGAFCTKYAHTLAEADLMERKFVSLGPLTMEPSDLLDILDGDKINYLRNLEHKSTTLEELKPLFPKTTCTQPPLLCEILHFQGQPAPSAMSPSAGGMSSAKVIMAIICAFGAASGCVVGKKTAARITPPKEDAWDSDLRTPALVEPFIPRLPGVDLIVEQF